MRRVAQACGLQVMQVVPTPPEPVIEVGDQLPLTFWESDEEAAHLRA